MKKIIFGVFAVLGLMAAQAEGVPLVPEGYAVFKYVSSEASGNPWASNKVGPYLQIYNSDKTPFVLGANDVVETKFNFVEANLGACVFCDRAASSGKFVLMRTGNTGNPGRFDYGTENNEFTSPSLANTSVHKVVASGSSLKIDGTSVAIKSSTYVPSSNALLIFCCDNSGNGVANNGNKGLIKIYYFRVKDGSGNVRLNLVPMKDAEGVAGMYDQVSGQFFKSANSSYALTAGGEATDADREEYFLPQSEDPDDPLHTHVWGEWVTTKEPQVGVPGEKQRTCSGCGEVETEVIPALPEPAAADAMLNFGSTEKSIRPALHGCGVAPRTRALGKSNETQILKDAGFYSCRAHDLALHDGAQAIVDLQQIFPLFSKDPDDPASYRFEPTDRVLAAITNAGMKIIFRLGSCGQSHGDDTHEYYNNIFTPSSDNYDKIAAVFSKIIAHYNEGWNHGFNLGIEYWEIWNEPDADPGNRWPSNNAASEFPQLFAKVVKKVKTDHPSVKIGGPASFQLNTNFFDSCLTACNTAGACPDFYTFHFYSHYCGSAKDPGDLTAAVENMRAHLASKTCAGKSCADIEIGVTEWNYYSGPSTEWYGRLTMEGAAWCAGVAQDLQYSSADFSNWYGAGYNASFGIYNGRDGVLSKTYYSLKMVGQLVNNYTKLAARTDTDTLHVLGAVNDAGTKGCIMVTDRTATARTLTIGLSGFTGKTLSNIKCYVTDDTRDIAEVTTGFTLQPNAPEAVALAKGATRSVWLLTFDIAE